MVFFYVCCYGFSQGRKSLYNTTVYVIKFTSVYLNLYTYFILFYLLFFSARVLIYTTPHASRLIYYRA